MRTTAFVVGALLAFGALATGSSLMAAETVLVDVQKYNYIPADITVNAGTPVRWFNT